MARKTPDNVEDGLGLLMDDLGVPRRRELREELAQGIQRRLRQLLDSGYRDLQWGDMRICLRLEVVGWRARNRPAPRKTSAGGA